MHNDKIMIENYAIDDGNLIIVDITYRGRDGYSIYTLHYENVRCVKDGDDDIISAAEVSAHREPFANIHIIGQCRIRRDRALDWLMNAWI